MAAGDILSVVIPAAGNIAEITIEGKGTGGTYAMGYTGNNVPSAAKVVFTVVSKGFDGDTPTTRVRTVWGTKFLRKAYPNNAQADETVSGSDVIVRVRLSSLIYAKDKVGGGNSGTDPTVTILAGFYTQAGGNNAVTNFAVTNNSTVAYKKPKALAAWAQFERVTGQLTMRVVAYERHAQQRKMVQAVRFDAVDEGAHTATVLVTDGTIDSAMADHGKVIEYKGQVAQTSFTQGDAITWNFKIYPWIGDVILDSNDGVNTGLHPRYSPQKVLCDKNATYGVTVALVDPTGSDSGANTVYDESVFNPATAYKFLTIGKAASAIAAYNNANRSRNDVGGGIVYLNAGNYAWLGSSNAYGNVPKAVITVKPTAGVARSAVTINAASGDSDISDRVKIENCTITANANNTFAGILGLWFDQCDLNTSGTGIFNTTGGVMWFTHCLVRRLDQGIRPFSTFNLGAAVVRGCDLTGFGHSILPYLVVGNKRTTDYAASQTLILGEITGSAAPYPDGCIIAFNKFYGFRLSSFDMITMGSDASRTHGCCIIQNIFECTQQSGGGALGFIGASESVTTNTPQDEYDFVHNTLIGGRTGFGYNSLGSTLKHRRGWSLKGNYIDAWGIKSDLFDDAVSDPDGARVGNWDPLYGMDFSGNINPEVSNIGSDGAFICEWYGVYSYQANTPQAHTYPMFVDRKSYSGIGNGAGDGDYRTQVGSPLRNAAPDLTLPFDIDGNPRTEGYNDAGAFTSPNLGGGGGGDAIDLGLGLGI
jgi:hypothetical protein